MKRFLCLSLCLGIMASACRLDITQKFKDTNVTTIDDSQIDKARRKARLSKQQVLEACLPQINTMLVSYYGMGRVNFFLRRNTKHNGTAAQPIVVLYISVGMPLEVSTTLGLGPNAVVLQANLKAMAASKVIQDQFVEREKVNGVAAPGYRIHISTQAPNESIAFAGVGIAPRASSNRLIIYDPEAIAAARTISPRVNADNIPDRDVRAGWYDCDVNEKTQVVTAWLTRATTQP